MKKAVFLAILLICETVFFYVIFFRIYHEGKIFKMINYHALLVSIGIAVGVIGGVIIATRKKKNCWSRRNIGSVSTSLVAIFSGGKYYEPLWGEVRDWWMGLLIDALWYKKRERFCMETLFFFYERKSCFTLTLFQSFCL